MPQCKAISKVTGEQCKAYSLLGEDFCVCHSSGKANYKLRHSPRPKKMMNSEELLREMSIDFKKINTLNIDDAEKVRLRSKNGTLMIELIRRVERLDEIERELEKMT